MPVGQTDIEAGRAFIPLRLVSEDWGQSIAKFGRQLQRASQRLRTAAMGMGVAAIMMATPFVAATKVFADFSKQMAFVATMLDAPQQHIADFTADIRRLSVEFGEATTTLSKGLYDILSAGFAPAQAMEMLAVTTRAAKAGMADAASATAAIIAVLNAYGLAAENAAYVSDVLFTTVRYGVLTFGELAGHIGLVASTAAQAGVSMEEMGAVLAIITRGGVETSHAVVALNNILKSFLMPTGAGADFAKKLKAAGLNFELSVKALREIGLVGVFKQIADLPTEALAQLFPTIRAARGVFAMKSGWKSLLEIVEKFYEPLGATERAMKEIRKSFGFLVDRVKQAGALILSYLGEALAGNLANLGEKVIDIALGFGKWIQLNKALIIWTVKLIATLGGLAITLLIIAKAMAVVAGIMMIIAGPYAWASMIAGAAAAAVMWVLVAKAIGEVKDALKGMEDLGRRETPSGGKKGVTGTAAAEYVVVNKNLEEQINLHEEQVNRLNKARAKVAKLRTMGATEPEERPFGEKRSLYAMEYSVAKAVVRSLEKQRDIAQSEIKRLTERQKILKSAADTEKARLAIMKQQLDVMGRIVGMSTRGTYLGYWHTPTLAFTSSYKTGGGDEMDLLTKIKENTAATVTAIEGKKPPVFD